MGSYLINLNYHDVENFYFVTIYYSMDIFVVVLNGIKDQISYHLEDQSKEGKVKKMEKNEPVVNEIHQVLVYVEIYEENNSDLLDMGILNEAVFI